MIEPMVALKLSAISRIAARFSSSAFSAARFCASSANFFSSAICSMRFKAAEKEVIALRRTSISRNREGAISLIFSPSPRRLRRLEATERGLMTCRCASQTSSTRLSSTENKPTVAMRSIAVALARMSVAPPIAASAAEDDKMAPNSCNEAIAAASSVCAWRAASISPERRSKAAAACATLSTRLGRSS